jgi:hypothetical protein
MEYELAMRRAEREWVAELSSLIKQSPSFSEEWRAWHVPRTSKES